MSFSQYGPENLNPQNPRPALLPITHKKDILCLGSDPGPDQGVGPADPEGGDGSGRLHGGPVPRLYRRHQRPRGHEEAGDRSAHRCRNPRPCLRHDLQEGPQVSH